MENSTIYGSINLRPTRIGFLVRPTDMNSIRKYMRLNTCLWGGLYNPIIPVSSRMPRDWIEKGDGRPAKLLAQDYVNFFEPDVFVEAEAGLSEKIGLKFSSETEFRKQKVRLDKFFSNKGNPFPEFGLSILDVYEDNYSTDLRFVRRDQVDWVDFEGGASSAIAEICFGMFPEDSFLGHYYDSYKKVFRPTSSKVSAENWMLIFRGERKMPFSPSVHNLEIQSRDNHPVTIFIVDQKNPQDLIDAWNIRIIRKGLYILPKEWLVQLSSGIVETVKEFMDVSGDRVEKGSVCYLNFSRSMSNQQVKELLSECFPNGIPHFISVGSGYPFLCIMPSKNMGPSYHRKHISAGNKDFQVSVKDSKFLSIDGIDPKFSSPFLRGGFRWVNVISFSPISNMDRYSLVYPSDSLDRRFPKIFSTESGPIISREGWVIGRTYGRLQLNFELEDGRKAIQKWFEFRGFKASSSGAGRIAQQMISSLGGLRGINIINDPHTIQLLDKMAAREVVRARDGQQVERRFEGRTASVKDWVAIIKRRAESSLSRVSLTELTDKGVLRAGLAARCPNCEHNNWYGLDQISYEIICERCLKKYPFPQGMLEGRDVSWKYRVIGPFSVPNYAEGAYSVGLTIKAFEEKILGTHTRINYSTGLELLKGNNVREIDFSFWINEDYSGDHGETTKFVFGEAKSFGREVIKDGDIDNLRAIAIEFPGSFIVVSVLKREFSPEEIKRLRKLAEWGRVEISGNRMRNPLIILTGLELFSEHSVRSSWEEASDVHKTNASHYDMNELESFSLKTQNIYLGMNPSLPYSRHPMMKYKRK